MSDEHSDYLRNGNLRTPNAAVWLEIADHIDAQAAELAALRERLAEAVLDLEQIVCTKEPDDGVVLLSNDGSTHYDPETKCQVYDHEHFSPLGDALIALHRKLTALAARKEDA